MRQKARYCSVHLYLPGRSAPRCRHTCLYTCTGNVCPQPYSKRLPFSSMQSRAPLGSRLILPFHRAQHVEPVILAERILTHI